VKASHIPQASVSTRYVCQFNIEGRVRQVNAQLLSDTIYCEALNFNYVTNQTNITATFAVIWDGKKPLDNPDNIHGKLFAFLPILNFILISILRLDFDNMIVNQPTTQGACTTDTFVTTSPSGYAPPTICGTNSGTHSKTLPKMTLGYDSSNFCKKHKNI